MLLSHSLYFKKERYSSLDGVAPIAVMSYVYMHIWFCYQDRTNTEKRDLAEEIDTFLHYFTQFSYHIKKTYNCNWSVFNNTKNQAYMVVTLLFQMKWMLILIFTKKIFEHCYLMTKKLTSLGNTIKLEKLFGK